MHTRGERISVHATRYPDILPGYGGAFPGCCPRLHGMKALALFLAAAALAASAHAAPVKGHVRKDGTYVEPHQRSKPNATKVDNYGTRGNVNPYTGKRGTDNPNK